MCSGCDFISILISSTVFPVVGRIAKGYQKAIPVHGLMMSVCLSLVHIWLIFAELLCNTAIPSLVVPWFIAELFGLQPFKWSFGTTFILYRLRSIAAHRDHFLSWNGIRGACSFWSVCAPPPPHTHTNTQKRQV